MRRVRFLALMARLLGVPHAVNVRSCVPVIYCGHDAKAERAIADIVNRAKARGLIA